MIIKAGKNKFDVVLYKNIIQHFIGLMFKIPKNDGILMHFNKENIIRLHTFFVFFRIDIVYFDDNKNVVKIIKNVRPFKFYIKGVKCKYILEVKDCKNIKLFDKLSI